MFYKWLQERKNLNILNKPYSNPFSKFSCKTRHKLVKTCKCLYLFVLMIYYKIFHLTNNILYIHMASFNIH